MSKTSNISMTEILGRIRARLLEELNSQQHSTTLISVLVDAHSRLSSGGHAPAGLESGAALHVDGEFAVGDSVERNGGQAMTVVDVQHVSESGATWTNITAWWRDADGSPHITTMGSRCFRRPDPVP